MIASDYKLTPGIYVGTEILDEDSVPYKEKMAELTQQLLKQFEMSNLLQELIKKDLEDLKE